MLGSSNRTGIIMAKTKREIVQDLFAERAESVEKEQLLLRDQIELAQARIKALDIERHRLDMLAANVDQTLTQTRSGSNDSDGEEE